MLTLQVIVFCSVIMSVYSTILVFDQLSYCTLQMVTPFFEWSVLAVFVRTTSFFMPQIQIECLTVIMYWLALCTLHRPREHVGL